MAVLPASPLFLLYVGVFLIAALTCFASLTRLHHITDSDATRVVGAFIDEWRVGGCSRRFSGLPDNIILKLGWYTLGLVLGLAAVGHGCTSVLHTPAVHTTETQHIVASLSPSTSHSSR